jgi:hypothetical protein
MPMPRERPNPDNVIRPLDLRRTASIAANYGDEGAVVITKGEEGIRIGVHNLAASDLQDMLCVAIYHSVRKDLT